MRCEVDECELLAFYEIIVRTFNSSSHVYNRKICYQHYNRLSIKYD
ncbi:hypothetical protein LCGC14_0548000 [marine sediment metagenome]|uniref:Uncharacterized protein n=1 Tax=marine sediment metagenome TaxID=412755 RepID=A0A0F9UZ70_9ZZZZ